ncbi:uncharacterized protein TRIADDRAFT_50901 [Trichoplax adhaerens]|uniref:GDP-fucose protein O-fucosyltransferase 2 n=1 Tax=Trichoplax adhaerens TaxID=10228 RepID=B3S8M7_TRIAD|nr:hypothetical protein TRIADDRAFT_50901 [Trichoplax adhaerens]EDV20912.1 hypothetical protein TRIADDRAFT_50901 [Trichoplax adhaerens]|eukprot:XP_002116556.1 hypothetical protein TRIADDRAFT_50901 [Trichoplax adhaerens]
MVATHAQHDDNEAEHQQDTSHAFLPSNTDHIQVTSSTHRNRYLIYDVNDSEGFNLRRDVYMRIANLIIQLNQRQHYHWTLVLPPWKRMYHWRSTPSPKQFPLPWKTFFDISSLNKFIPVMEYQDYINQFGQTIDEIIYLQPYPDPFEGGQFVDKVEETNCQSNQKYKLMNGNYYGYFFGLKGITARKLRCMLAQGMTSIIIPKLQQSKARLILLDRAENLLHEAYGQVGYWNSRRSLVFAKHLRDEGNRYRQEILNSTDEQDHIVRHSDWRLLNVKKSKKRGGNYLAVHLRRRDFLQGRKNDIPSLEEAVLQIKSAMKKTNLSKVFLATDAEESGLNSIRDQMEIMLCYVTTTPDRIQQFGDGGIAIIDQWICAHAKYFIGSKESTFSFRIYEERELMGFKSKMTYNQLCNHHQSNCEGPSEWKVVY